MGKTPRAEEPRVRRRREIIAKLKKGDYIIIESTEAEADVVIKSRSVVPLRIEKGRR